MIRLRSQRGLYSSTTSDFINEAHLDTETDLYPTSQLFVTIMKYLTQGTYGEKGFIEFQV